jgi:HopA1 effector protein family
MPNATTVFMQMADTLFKEIADEIIIKPNLAIHHPRYPEWLVSELVSNRLQNSPREIQAKFIFTQLQDYLHGLYFSRSLLPVATSTIPVTTPAVVSNTNIQGIDTAFYAQIDRANCSQGYYDQDWLIEDEEDDGLVSVVKDGLRLCVWPSYIYPNYQTLVVGDLATIRMPKNLLTIDRYIAVSNDGRMQQQPTINIYFSCPAATAIEVTRQITTELNFLELPFELQVQLAPSKYQQTDSLILQLAVADYSTAQPALSKIHRQYRSQFYDQTPSLTQSVATGVGLSTAATNQQGISQLWQLVAQALAESWLHQVMEPAMKLDRIWQALEPAKITAAVEISDGQQQPMSNLSIYQSW